MVVQNLEPMVVKSIFTLDMFLALDVVVFVLANLNVIYVIQVYFMEPIQDSNPVMVAINHPNNRSKRRVSTDVLAVAVEKIVDLKAPVDQDQQKVV